MDVVGLLKKFGNKVKAMFVKLVSLKDTPHSIAGGLAIGIFLGFTPLFGVKTLLALGLAYLLRCNPISAVVAVSLHDIVAPLWPFLLRFEYDIGYWIMSHPHVLPPKLESHHFHPGDLLKWSTFVRVGPRMLLGSLFLSIPASIVSYFLMIFVLTRTRLGRRVTHDSVEK
jgi:uncharacterized protein